MQLAERAVELSEAVDLKYLYTLALAYFKTGNQDEEMAINKALDLLSDRPTDSEATLLREALGNKLKEYREAFEEKP